MDHHSRHCRGSVSSRQARSLSVHEPANGRHAVWRKLSMRKRTKEKRVKAVPVGIGILVFILAFIGGVVSKLAIAPSWAKEYSVQWSDKIGTLKTDIP